MREKVKDQSAGSVARSGRMLRRVLLVVGMMGAATALSGCIVVDHPYHPRRYYWY